MTDRTADARLGGRSSGGPVLVVGASGDLGGELCRRLVAAGSTVVGTYHRAPADIPDVRWERLDIRDRPSVATLVRATEPSTVVNTAYDNTDWATTADGAAHVAAAAVEVGARLVHISSDAVHRGRPTPYLDDEPPSPLYFYGAAKAAAETAVRLVDPSAAVIRTSLIVGDLSSKQVRLCVDLINGTVAGALFSDHLRRPIGLGDLAAAVLEVAASDYAGLLNVAGPDTLSRYELGLLVAAHYGLRGTVPVSTSVEAGFISPGEVALDSSRARSLLATPLRGIHTLLPSPPSPPTPA